MKAQHHQRHDNRNWRHDSFPPTGVARARLKKRMESVRLYLLSGAAEPKKLSEPSGCGQDMVAGDVQCLVSAVGREEGGDP